MKNIVSLESPFERTVSLVPLIELWRTWAGEVDSPHGSLARDVLAQVDAVPELQAHSVSHELLQQHSQLVTLLMSALLPMAKWDNLFAAAYPPFDDQNPFFITPGVERFGMHRIEKLIEGMNTSKSSFPLEQLMQARLMNTYHMVLKAAYGIEIEFDYPAIFTGVDPDTGMIRHFQMDFDTSFVRVQTQAEHIELTEEDIERLQRYPLDYDLWESKLPSRDFSMHGFVLVRAVDVTNQEVLSLLKHDLLQKDSMTSLDKIADLQKRLRTLMQAPDLHLGLIALERGELDTITGVRGVGHSLLLSNGDMPSCPNKSDSYYMEAVEEREPILVVDLAPANIRSSLGKHLYDAGFRNIMIIPLVHEQQVIGLLELASETPGRINDFNSIKLAEVVPLFTTAMSRHLAEREDRVQAVIKEQYTAIHPSVEWRFRKAVLDYMAKQQSGQRARIEPIVFPQVYPLYGLTDVRGSSTLRSESIRHDLVEQLRMSLEVIVEASIYQPLPIIDEIGFRITKYIENLQSGLSSGEESDVLDFVRGEVEPLFERIRKFGSSVEEKTQAYFGRLDDRLGVVYEERQAFEESITLLNDTVASFIDEQAEQAQEMFPHYFEKFKTDGVDYNIYVGDSLLENGSFDMLYLHNLRLWQLMMTCGVCWELERLRPSLQKPLEAAHLILVHSNPLSIRFRFEEKKFDVDGAYNIRYEIIKKRIDKVHIRDTGERLTQPGMIAVVYTQERDATEYLRYAEYLTAAGYFIGEPEHHLLEDLQGVSGLKALRFAVNPTMPGAESWAGDFESISETASGDGLNQPVNVQVN